MAISHKNRVQMTVTGTPGTGTITLNAASSAYQTFAAAYAGNATVDILIVDGTAWEVARACTYTNSGTTVTRGTLEASSTGSAISLTSAAVVSQIPTAQWGNWLESAMQAVTPGGRLTLTSGTPVTTSDVTGATSVYYTPYVHDTITLWDGARWIPVTFTEITHALGTVTSGANYDFFGYLSSGALAIEKLVWTNGTTRATAVTLQDGRYCKSGDKTRLYLGTVRSTSTTATEDSQGGTSSQVGGKRFVWNMYNRVQRSARVYDGTASWNYTTATIRQANAATGNKVELLVGLGVPASANVTGLLYHKGAVAEIARWGIGLNTTTAFSGRTAGVGYFLSSGAHDIYFPLVGHWMDTLAAGYSELNWIETGANGTCQFQGGADSGLNAMVMA
jgi:hypothetical protein